MKKPIDFNTSGFNSHLKDIQKAEAVLLELIAAFKEQVGNEPQDFTEFIKDPYTYTGELLTNAVKVEGIELTLDKKLFLTDIDLSVIHNTYSTLKEACAVSEVNLLDFTPDYKVSEAVLEELKVTYTTYAETKAEKDLHKQLEALVSAYNTIHHHMKDKGLTPSVNTLIINRSDLQGVRVNTQAFKIIARSLNRS